MLKINDASNFRRTVTGPCLIAGPLVALIGALLTPPTQSGTLDAYLQAFAKNPARTQVSAVLLYFGNLLIAVSIFGIIHLLRHRAVVLAHIPTRAQPGPLVGITPR